MNILLVTSRYPWPARRGDQLRATQLLDLLAGRHTLTLLAPQPGAGQAAPPAGAPFRVETYRPGGLAARPLRCARALAEGLPLENGLFYSPDLARRLRALAPTVDRVVLQLVRLAEHAADAGDTPLVVDLIDSLALNVEQRALCDRPWLRPALRWEARLLADAERRLAERALRVLVVAERDRRALAERLPPSLGDRLAVVRLAVEPGAAAPAAAGGHDAGGTEDAGTAPTLVLTGNLGYFVNVDAVTWWLREVWPRLCARAPAARLVIAGDRPARAVVRAVARAAAPDRVALLSSPADLRSVLARATLALAPMRCGSGVPLKILEAWSAGVPVVASPWATAGTTGRPGEDLRVAERPGDWIETILDLLASGDERRRLAANARRRLQEDYSRTAVAGQWGAVFPT